MSYFNTFITAADDCPVVSGVVPAPRNGKPTIATLEYEMLHDHPYTYTEEDVQFRTHLVKNELEGDPDGSIYAAFAAKPRACFRASPLVKKHGWGMHYDAEGKIALVPMESEAYQSFLQRDDVTVLKGMRSKRA